MNSKFLNPALAGISGTVVMSIVMFLAPMMGIPKMSPPEMLSGMMNMPLFAGWMMHFMIGIIFALTYYFLFAPKVKISNLILKGSVFGLAVFVFAQIMMAIMSALTNMPKMEGSMVFMMIGSIIGHIIYGIVVSKIVKF